MRRVSDIYFTLLLIPFFILLILVFFVLNCFYIEHKYSGLGLGTFYTLKLGSFLPQNREKITTLITESLEKVENEFSFYRKDSILSDLNRNKVLNDPPEDFSRLIRFSLQLSVLSEGYYDITIGPLKKLWSDLLSGEGGVPSQYKNQKALKNTGYENILFSERSILLKNSVYIT